MKAGRVRKVRWWQHYLDRDVRAARRRVKNMSPNEQMVTVDYTEGGVAITVPHSIRREWENMPYEARQEFMQAVDAEIKNNPTGNADGMHSLRIED